MGKTTRVAKDRAYDQTKSVIPAEYARGLYVENPPSARALKLMHLMIAVAGGRMAAEERHQMRLADIRAISGMANHDRKSLKPLFKELRACVLSIDDPEKMKDTIGGFLDEAEIDYSEEAGGDLQVSWYFARTFRKMAEQSDHWAILDRQTLFSLSSKYSILLFQYFASLQNLSKKTTQTFTVTELRSLLGIPDNKLPRFANLNRDALQPAIKEINQLSRFTLSAMSKKVGRTVTTVEINWEPKIDPSKVKKELKTSKIGRRARRDGTAETLAIAFPSSGSITFAPDKRWQLIARTHGNGKDIDLIAQDFRKWCDVKNIKLDAGSIEKTFTAFCQRCKV